MMRERYNMKRKKLCILMFILLTAFLTHRQRVKVY